MTKRRWIIFGVIDLVVIVAVVAIVLASSGGDSDSGDAAGKPEIVTTSQLSELAAESEQPIYWLGERPGAHYELTDDGERIYVRYLQGDATAGDPRSSFVAVATYPAADGLAELRHAVSKRQGAQLVQAADGATVLIDPSSPDNAHLVYPDSGVQVEVYSPVPGQALRLASSGKLEPVS